jgi:hypothetical protein
LRNHTGSISMPTGVPQNNNPSYKAHIYIYLLGISEAPPLVFLSTISRFFASPCCHKYLFTEYNGHSNTLAASFCTVFGLYMLVVRRIKILVSCSAEAAYNDDLLSSLTNAHICGTITMHNINGINPIFV